MDLSTGALVEDGWPWNHRCPEHRRAGNAAHDAHLPRGRYRVARHRRERNPHEARRPRQAGPHPQRRQLAGPETSFWPRNGEVIIIDQKERELEKYTIPNGAVLLVNENDDIKIGQVICQWDPLSVPLLAEVGGKVRYEDFIEGDSIRTEVDTSGTSRTMIIEHKGDLHPQIMLEDASGKILDFYFLPEKAIIEVPDGQMITAGTVIAKTPRELGGTQDITSGLPRVTELFEARRPKDPAIIAEIDGEIDLMAEKKRGKRVIIVRAPDGTEKEYIIPHGKHLRVHAKDLVKAGDALVDGPLVPHDILRVSGEEAVQQYLLREIQNVYRRSA